jgi:hypothetical protein
MVENDMKKVLTGKLASTLFKGFIPLLGNLSNITQFITKFVYFEV